MKIIILVILITILGGIIYFNQPPKTYVHCGYKRVHVYAREHYCLHFKTQEALNTFLGR